MKNLILTLLTLLLPASALADQKTVCSITINSTEEVNAFKKALDPELWKFIELTQVNGPSGRSAGKAWFAQACQQKIQCDILLISGHFGGHFFGETGLRLSMEELEERACNSNCDGIISRPKEVFLFGCNTLAEKGKDGRTPEQYLRVLLNDGFSMEQAQEVVAFRYSEFGGSFKSRMSQVFATTPRIYGFSSRGPSGPTVQPMLRSYFESAKSDYNHFSEITPQRNEKLLSALGQSPIVQTPGLSFIDPTFSKNERPYCYLANNKNSVLTRLNYIYEAMTSGRTLPMMSYISRFFDNLGEKKYVFNKDEVMVLERLRQNKNIIQQLEQLLLLQGDVYLKVRVEALKLIKNLRILNPAEFQSAVSRTLNLNFQTQIDWGLGDLICSLDVQADLNLPANAIMDQTVMKIASCLKPKDPATQNKIASVLKNKVNGWDIRSSAAQALGDIGVFSASIETTLLQILQNESEDKFVRSSTIRALGNIHATSATSQSTLLKALQTDQYNWIRAGAAESFGKLGIKSNSVLSALKKAFLEDSDVYVRAYSVMALAQLGIKSKVVREGLKQIVKDNLDSRTTAEAKRLLAMSQK